MKEFLLTDWKAWFAAVATSLLSGMEWMVGNPFGPEGHLILLVIVMSLIDFASGSVVAIVTKTWRFARLKQGIWKLFLWGGMLVVARALGRPTMVIGADTLFKFIADYLLVYLILVDLISILKHCAAFSLVIGVEVPFLDRLIIIVQRWHDTIPEQKLDPSAVLITQINPLPPKETKP